MHTLQVLEVAVPDMQVHRDRLESAMTKELFVTDEVYKRVAAGEAFREAYLDVKKNFFATAGA